jgi:hypothetical protein
MHRRTIPTVRPSIHPPRSVLVRARLSSNGLAPEDRRVRPASAVVSGSKKICYWLQIREHVIPSVDTPQQEGRGETDR